MSNIFDLGVSDAMRKIAASGNPAAPVKSSLGGMERMSPSAPYTNGGGKAVQQVPGSVQSQPQPWPGYVNHSKGAPQQTAGDVAGRAGSPDTGDLGLGQGGDMTVTKSAAFALGVEYFLSVDDDE